MSAQNVYFIKVYDINSWLLSNVHTKNVYNQACAHIYTQKKLIFLW